MANIHQIPDASEDVAAYSNEADTNVIKDAVMEKGKMTRSLTTEDISLSADWKDTILANYPHEVITEDIFLVTISKTELENILGNSIETDETKTQLFIRFTTTKQ